MANASALPDDVLHIICDQLGQQRDFSALFSCALTARRWSDPALVVLYRLYNVSPIIGGGTDETEFNRQNTRGTKSFVAVREEQELVVRKWAILWRSIALSSFNWTSPGSPTYREYCRYIRALNLRDLVELLQDGKFYSCAEYFFAKPLDTVCVKSAKTTPKRKGAGRFQTVDVDATVSLIGETITKKTLALEDISGRIKAEVFPAWIRRSPKLQSITVWHGSSLSDGAEAAIRTSCPHFRSLSVYQWESDPPNQADSQAAKVFEGLTPNSVEEFIVISQHNLGASSFQALSRHASSLTDLKISNLREDSLTSLHLLKDCTSLRNLSLDDFESTTSLEARHNDVFLGLVSWLTSCPSLKQISLQRLLDGPTLLTSILKTPSIQLEKLSVTGYVAATPSARAFHAALTSHTSLTSLSIKADGEDLTSQDRNSLVTALCTLPSLRELELKDISDEFTTTHISRLARSLPQLEHLWVSGESITDNVLPPLSTLLNLRSLMLYALTRFSADALLEFVERLEAPGNKGFQLGVVNAEVESQVSEDEVSYIRERIAERVEGGFDFNYWRDPDVDSFEGDSD